MSPQKLQSKLRRLLHSTMSVRRDPYWARRHGFHPDAYQVWDQSTRGESYVVFVCQRNGLPIEPNEDMIAKIRAMDASVVHGGRKSWSSHMAGEGDRISAKMKAARDKAFRERFDYDFTPKAEFMTGHGRVYGLNGEMVPK